MTPRDSLRRAELLARFAATPDRTAAAATAAEGRPRAAGEWTPGEIVRHLIAVDHEVWGPRLRQLAGGGSPRWAWVEPRFDDGPEDRPMSVLINTFAAGRRRLVDHVRDLDPAGWARSGTHETMGILDVEAMLRETVAHDDEHLASIERPATGEPGAEAR
jgi:DinB superfamily